MLQSLTSLQITHVYVYACVCEHLRESFEEYYSSLFSTSALSIQYMYSTSDQSHETPPPLFSLLDIYTIGGSSSPSLCRENGGSQTKMGKHGQDPCLPPYLSHPPQNVPLTPRKWSTWLGAFCNWGSVPIEKLGFLSVAHVWKHFWSVESQGNSAQIFFFKWNNAMDIGEVKSRQAQGTIQSLKELNRKRQKCRGDTNIGRCHSEGLVGGQMIGWLGWAPAFPTHFTTWGRLGRISMPTYFQ